MQDKQINVPETGELPADFLERLAASDVVILVGSSESQDQELTMHTILPGGLFDPERILSHAYAHALQGEHVDLVRKVHGQPTDAMRFRALRAFGQLFRTDVARFEQINEALQAFEESEGLADEAARTDEDYNRIADFILQSLLETEPAEQAADQEGLDVKAPSIILPN